MRLVVNLCEWQLFRMISAVALSLGAVLFFVVMVGLVLLPADVQRLREPLYLSVLQSYVPPQSERALSLVWYMPRRDTNGWVHRLAWHELRGERPHVEFAWPQLVPSGATLRAATNELLVCCWDGSMWRLDLSRPTSAPQRLAHRVEMAAHVLACSADGRWLAVLGPQRLDVVDLSTGEAAWKLDGGQVRAVAMHPSEPRLAVGLTSGECAELDAASGSLLRSVAKLEHPGIHMTFSPAGDRLAVVTGGGGNHLLDWVTGSSAWPAEWRDTRHVTRSAIAQFSPSGERLIMGAGHVESLAVWNLRTMQLERELHGHARAINGVSFLDEHRLCSFGADGTIRIWDLKSLAPPEVLTIDVTSQAG